MDIREDFCGLCAAVPIALASFGITGSAVSLTADQYEIKKKIYIALGFATLIVSLILLLSYSSCTQCLAPPS